VEYHFRHSVIGGEAPEEPVEPVPAADVGDAEEMEFVVVARNLPHRDRLDLETVSYRKMGFFRISGA